MPNNFIFLLIPNLELIVSTIPISSISPATIPGRSIFFISASDAGYNFLPLHKIEFF